MLYPETGRRPFGHHNLADPIAADDSSPTEICGTISSPTSSIAESDMYCYGSDWPGFGNLGSWDSYILMGFGGHPNNRGNNLSGSSGTYTDAAYFVR